MSELIRVAVFEPGAPVAFTELSNELAPMQELVGGYIEIVGITDDGLCLVCNEEGKIDGLPPNRAFSGLGGSDLIVGTFFVCRCDEEGEMTSIEPEDETLLKAWTPERTWNIVDGKAA